MASEWERVKMMGTLYWVHYGEWGGRAIHFVLLRNYTFEWFVSKQAKYLYIVPVQFSAVFHNHDDM